MARPNYGPQAKKRTKRLLAALLAYADDQLEDYDQPQLQVNWQTDNQLVVRTKVRFLAQLTAQDAYEGKLSNEQIKEALKRLEDVLEILEDNRTTTRGSEDWHFTLKLWHRRHYQAENLNQFDREWERRRPEKSKQLAGEQGSRRHGDTGNRQSFSPHPPLSVLPLPGRSPSPHPRQDWGEAIDVSVFYGRSEELATLEQWIVTDRCRLIAVLGIGGIGKTALSVKLAEQIQDQFEYVVWRSLRNAPPLDTLLSDLVLFLSDQQDTKAELGRLVHWLRTSRCLVILDNAETILQGSDCVGQYRPGYETYADLLRVVGETPHQSCLMLTSREKPTEIAALEGIDAPVRSLQLQGSSETAQSLIQARGLSGSVAQQQELSQRYGNNPLALKVVATSIQDLFGGEIGEFLAHETIVFNGIRRLLDQQFDRLSALERSIMYWLAINREWTTIAELREDIVPAASKANLLEALESLSWRSLIEKKSGRYTQQPVVMEYVTEHLIEQVSAELTEKQREILSPHSLTLFQSHALLKTTIKDYVRESQLRLILQPVAAQFHGIFSSAAALQEQILRILIVLRQTGTRTASYGGGNLINLCCQLQLDLTSYDFSGLSIWHAYLQKVDLHRVNFQNADLAKCIFTQTFSDIFCIAFSPDGKLLAAGEPNGEIRLWRVADGQLLWTCKGHTNWVMSVAWSPDNAIIASSSADHTVKLWDAHTGQTLKTLQGHTNSVHSLSWHPKGTMIVTGSEDHTIRLWEVQTGQTWKVLHGHTSWIWSVDWSPDGTMLASGSVDHTIKLWDVQTGQVLQTLQDHSDQVSSVTWSPDGTMLASGSVDHTVKLWDVQMGQVIKTLQGHTNWVRSVHWSPDGRVIASGGDDCTVNLWNVQTGQIIKTLPGHTNWVRSVHWHPEGSMLASGSVDHTIKFWDVQTGQALRTLEGYTNWVHSVVWSPDGRIIASGSEDHRIRLWNARTGQVLRALQGHTNWVYSVVWSPDGTMLASSSADHTVKLWDTRTGQVLRTLQGHTNWVLSVAWSPDGTMLASSGVDHTVKLWDAHTGQVLRTLQGHTDWVWAVAWSPNGAIVASSSEDHVVKLWDVCTGKVLKTLRGHTNAVRPVAWSPDGNILASGSADHTVKLWDVHTGKVLRTLQGHTNWVSSVNWSPDGSTIASGGEDYTVKLWDIGSGETLKTLQGHTYWVCTVTYAPRTACSGYLDGQILASGSADETIKLWNINTGECLRTLRSVRFYEGMNITGATGITEAQKATLKALGAVDQME